MEKEPIYWLGYGSNCMATSLVQGKYLHLYTDKFNLVAANPTLRSNAVPDGLTCPATVVNLPGGEASAQPKEPLSREPNIE